MQAIRGPRSWSLVECNPRFGGASSLSVEAGLDSFRWFLLEAGGHSLELTPFRRASRDLRLVRFAADWIGA
jgi:carbamoyl-phosphate synthase large subunit